MIFTAVPPSALPGISPSRGEIGKRRKSCSIGNDKERSETLLHPISPLEGEMPGRAEGGATASHESNQAPALR
nr:Propionyl-coenzyme A carboxylase alpha polypeptide [Rhizobiaceae bacterium]